MSGIIIMILSEQVHTRCIVPTWLLASININFNLLSPANSILLIIMQVDVALNPQSVIPGVPGYHNKIWCGNSSLLFSIFQSHWNIIDKLRFGKFRLRPDLQISDRENSPDLQNASQNFWTWTPGLVVCFLIIWQKIQQGNSAKLNMWMS